MSSSSRADEPRAVLGRVCRGLGWCAIVTASPLVFPSGIPWMIAAWLLAYTLLALVSRRGLLCLGVCAAILVAKRLTPAPGLLALLVVMLVVIVVGVVNTRRRRVRTAEQLPSRRVSRRFVWISIVALWIAWAGMTFDWIWATHIHHRVTLKGSRPVVCLGDSMTSLGMFGGYPQKLQKRISLPAVDEGTPGWSAKQVVEHHTELADIAKHNPQVVVIELGAHDFLRFHSRAETKANLKKIIDASRKMGAEVALMEIPRAYMSDPFWGLEREIAREEDVELIPDTALRMLFLHSPLIPPGSWLGGPYLTDEGGIHPNAAGNEVLADSVAAALERMYGPAILREPPATPRQSN
ncbi:MAG: GDSL-type esterase/lipase family protein [Thermoguttaceae bacterium]